MLDQPTNIEPRLPKSVMRLAHMGQSMPHKLSFSRQIIRCLIANKAQVDRAVWQINQHGHGRAVYRVDINGNPYSLVAVSSPLDDSMRSDRVIAEAWDTCFTLFDGVPTKSDLDRLELNQTRQEAGRYSKNELTLSRANKSMRLFQYVRDCLVNGEQPEANRINEIGYLMRTTAVYGNGKFGIADRHDYADRPEMAAPFQAEMLTVWLIREFTHDLVEHCAACLNPNAARLDPALKRHLGVGNATGLGMAPFLVHHPELLNRWVTAREEALAVALNANEQLRGDLIDRVEKHLEQWNVADAEGQANIERSRAEWRNIPRAPTAQELINWAKTMSLGTHELVVSLVLENTCIDLEPYAQAMAFEGTPALNLGVSTAVLRDRLASDYAWALRDTSDEHWFWYVSENKLEPRIGERTRQEGSDRERPLAIVRNMQALDQALADFDGTCLEFISQRPEFVTTIRRLMSSGQYGEIQDNLLGPEMRPIDMLRFKLAFFGATKFDPKSCLWTRITLFQGAPTRDALGNPGDDWWLSAL